MRNQFRAWARFMTAARMTEAERSSRFLVHEARLLDEKRYDEWNALFTDDAHYWVPLARDQPDADTTPRSSTRTSCCATCASSA